MESNETEKFSISPISPGDVEAMIAMIQRSLDPFEEAGSVLAATYRRLNNFQTIYDGKLATYFVVKDMASGALIGGAGFGPFVGLSPDEKIGEIRELVIDKQFRGKGAGKAILKRCLNYATEHGYSRIYLETTPKMEHAQNLFKRFKFKPVTQSLHKSEGNDSVPCYFMLEGLT